MKYESILSGVLALSAAAIAAAFVSREFRSDHAGSNTLAQKRTPPTYVANWNQLLSVGNRMGDTTAPIKVIEFADFECPFCRTADSALQVIRDKFGNRVEWVFIHFPIRSHRFARPAARAAECAARQNRFAEFQGVLYRKQDSLGLKSWTSYATEAGIPRLKQFSLCNASTEPVAKVDAGVAAGKRFGVHGTPTFLLNGWLLLAPLTWDEFDASISAMLAGKQPFGRANFGATH